MALTNFGKLTDEQLTVWSRDWWRQARNHSFLTRFTGDGANSLIQRITKLTSSDKGARAVITLLADLEGDGMPGDRMLEGSEEPLKSHDTVITIDQWRFANRSEGRMAEQASIVNFRTNSRDKLAYQVADRIDQAAFLTLSGISYTLHNDGRIRVGSNMRDLEFAAAVKPPSAKRVGRWNATTKEFVVGDGRNTVTAADTPTWELFETLKAYAMENYLRGINAGGEETYHAFLSPTAMMRLRQDETYLKNLRHSTITKVNDKLFEGGAVKINGVVLHEFRHVPNTRRAPVGDKFGAAGDVDGCQVLFCGAQALAFADIGQARWVEKEFDYDNQPGISIAKILGFLKPQFPTQYSGGTLEDHGVISAFVAQ